MVRDLSSDRVQLRLEASVQGKHGEGGLPDRMVHCRRHAGERVEGQVLVPRRVVVGSEEEGFIILNRVVSMENEGAMLACM